MKTLSLILLLILVHYQLKLEVETVYFEFDKYTLTKQQVQTIMAFYKKVLIL
jgi:N-glycosylase/DNA lyase